MPSAPLESKGKGERRIGGKGRGGGAQKRKGRENEKTTIHGEENHNTSPTTFHSNFRVKLASREQATSGLSPGPSASGLVL